ncbi:MAG: O-antigen ligase family protein [Candidatus Shapirobacteria bacterium]|nr:O-antigen ligase family protein [Candidatus Shapirobacteria bacterium]
MALVLLVFIPLYPKLPSLEVPGSYVRIRLEDFAVAIAFLTALPTVWQRRKNLFKNSISQGIIVYWLVGLAATISTLLITRLVWPHLAWLHYFRRIEYMGLFFLGILAIRNKKDFKVFLIALFITISLIFIYGLGQKFYSLPAISTMNEEFSKGATIELDVWTRIAATFAGHYDLAIFMTLVMPIVLAIFFATQNKLKKIGLVLVFVSCYYLLILTASRVSFIAYLVSISFLLLLLKKKWWLIPIIGLSLLGSLFSEDINQRFAATIKVEGPKITQKINQALDFFLTEEKQKELAQKKSTTPTSTITEEETELDDTKEPSKIPKKTGQTVIKLTPTPPEQSRHEAAEIGVERSGDIRFGVEWPRALRHFKKNPILGTGYSSITLATDNDYLRTLGETGLLGFLALISIFLAQVPVYLNGLTKKKINQETKFLTMSLAASTIALLISMLFIDALESSKIAFSYWLILGLVIGRINLDKKDEQI